MHNHLGVVTLQSKDNQEHVTIKLTGVTLLLTTPSLLIY